VAIGDSFTEGVGDELADGTVVGWADRVAAGLAAANGGIQYANLAVRGRLLEPIITDQLGMALSLDPTPTLITLNGGGNDMLRPGGDVARLTALTAQAIERCGAAGVRLVLLSGPDPSDRLPFGSTLRRRAEAFTAAVTALVAEHGNLLVDAFHDTEIRRAGYWSTDRLHLNSLGHQRVASLVLAALGQPAAAPDTPADLATRRRLRSEAAYYRQHVVPWVNRRLRGRSSGDGRTGKHQTWVSVAAS
jgi:lysophospholipase L1-like esterase